MQQHRQAVGVTGTSMGGSTLQSDAIARCLRKAERRGFGISAQWVTLTSRPYRSGHNINILYIPTTEYGGSSDPRYPRYRALG